ncbi:hypothetical protein C8J56DRAFT_780242 [Mycena floridula]|nr:hypothetical protein C8J56DRAFT_780242 [Mycena floridula]
MSSSKRGRKRNDNLPPNRARDVQRAFRARRAAHLQALEERVSELEDENNTLRHALNLPPANRQPLGKGPTGKDKPKSFEANLANLIPLQDSRDSSSAEPISRGSSLSPMQILAPPLRSMSELENTWEQTIIIPDKQSEAPSSSASSPYLSSPLSAPISSAKSIQYPYAALNSAPRSLMSAPIYLSQHSYSPASERRLSATYGNHSFVMRPEDQRQQYSYSQPSFDIQSAHPSPIPYPQRFPVSQGYHALHTIQIPSTPPLQDGCSPISHRQYGPDGHIINAMS